MKPNKNSTYKQCNNLLLFVVDFLLGKLVLECMAELSSPVVICPFLVLG